VISRPALASLTEHRYGYPPTGALVLTLAQSRRRGSPFRREGYGGIELIVDLLAWGCRRAAIR
jgi:hypothetical protein